MKLPKNLRRFLIPLVIVLIIINFALSSTSKSTKEFAYKVETISASCMIFENEPDIRAVGNSIQIIFPMNASTPCYSANATATFSQGTFRVKFYTEELSRVCVQCIGEIVGKVMISDLKPGNYGVDVQGLGKALITTIMIR